MSERIILVLLGAPMIVAAWNYGRKEGWNRVMGEFPFFFTAFWLFVLGLGLAFVGVAGIAV